MKLGLLIRASSLIALAASSSAFAQEGAEEELGGDIVVTAQKRAENLQDVPISISAFNSEAIESANILSVTDLSKVAVNFQTARSSSVAATRINIRGIGAAGNTTIEPSVAVFVDGVYVPRAGAVIGNMLDIDGVEVLRGPQGTLFGRNASVGALSLRSALPEFDLSGMVGAEIGNGDRYKIKGHINLPLSDNVALRVAGMGQWFGGYWKNRLDGRQLGGSDDIAFRASLRAELGNLDWVIRGDYSRSKGDGFANFDFDASSVSPAQLEALRVRLGGVLPDTNLKDNKANQFVTADLDDRNWGVSSDASLEIGGGTTLRLINSYREWDNEQLDGDVAFTPVPILSRQSAFLSQSHNHELQLISPEREWLGGALDFVGGLYFFQEDFRIDEAVNLNSQFCNTLVAAGASRDACNSYLATTGGIGATKQVVKQSLTSLAAYGQATVHVSDTLSATVGLRYTDDSKSGLFDQRIFTPFAATLRAPEILDLPDVDESRLTYRFNLSYKPSSDFMAFATYSTGYKSGGYNSGGGTPSLSTFDGNGNLISTRRIFGRETVDNYEIGARTSWLDDQLLANITFYRMDIGGFQDRSFDGIGFLVRNAGNLRQQGFEFDTAIRPSANFTFRAALAYLDSEFTDFPAASNLPGIGGTRDLKGFPANYSPKWSGNVGFDWRGDIGSSGLGWELNSNLSFVSDQYVGGVSDGNPQSIEDGYYLLGARFSIKGPDDRWSIAIFGNNITGTDYSYINLYQVLDGALGLRNGVFTGSSAVRRAKADPRTFGAAVSFRF
jgi:iron complex outermembrane receptor protein